LTRFSGSLFDNTNLFKANLKNCINYNINPLNNNIKKAKFSLPEALTLLDAFEIQIQ
jgi:fluoroquinolone resistance protein